MPEFATGDGPLARLATPFDPLHVETYMRIYSSTPFRNLTHKRQVHRPKSPFFALPRPRIVPQERLTHVGFVHAIAREIAARLGLNGYLTGAGAFGHDCGHVLGGHFGEKWIQEMSGKDFLHEYFGLVILGLAGIDLPHEVAQCIALHSWHSGVMTRGDVTEECRAVALADKIAYVAYDSLEAHQVISEGGYDHILYDGETKRRLLAELDELLAAAVPGYRPFTYAYPVTNLYVPGRTADKWRRENRLAEGQVAGLLHTAIRSITDAAIAESAEVGRVSFSKCPQAQAFMRLKEWLSQNIYRHADNVPYETKVMEGTYAFVKEHFPRHDTLLAMTAFNDLVALRAAVIMGAIPRPPGLQEETAQDLLYDLDVDELLYAMRDVDPQIMFAQPAWAALPKTPPS